MLRHMYARHEYSSDRRNFRPETSDRGNFRRLGMSSERPNGSRGPLRRQVTDPQRQPLRGALVGGWDGE